jgi:hypothetical protein
LRPNIQLNTGLYYPPDSKSPRGTFDATDPDPRNPAPVVEVQVYGGTAVLDATVKGLFQRLGRVEDQFKGDQDSINEYEVFDFHDDGKEGDRVPGDGVYSARIALDPKLVPARGAEYRVAIQAFTTPEEQVKGTQARNIQPEASDAESLEQVRNGEKLPEKYTEAIKFQRASSTRFRVENSGGGE